MKVVSRTDIGCVRASNQDVLLLHQGMYPLYGVADGMGGHRAGDVASRMTVDMLKAALAGKKPSQHALRAAVEEINRAVYKAQQQNPDYEGMGTTLTMIWEDERNLMLAHVGDSRAYLLRDGKIKQITCDHSLVGELLRDGQITEEEAARHPYRNVITRAIGTEETVLCDIIVVDKKAGDKWLLCSDGLSEYVSDGEMAQRLENMNLEDAANALLLRALSLGGRDNVSLLLAEVPR